MARNLQILAYGYHATHEADGTWPAPGAELLTGGSPRYQIYPTADGRHVACAALEDKFWQRLTELVGLDPELRDDTGQESRVIDALTAAFAAQPADHWRQLLDGEDVCTAVVATWDEAVATGLVTTGGPDRVAAPSGGPTLTALPSPVSPTLRRAPHTAPYPALVPLPGVSPWASTPSRRSL